MSCRATLSDLIKAITQNMSAAEMAKAAINIQIQQMIHDGERLDTKRPC